jgi:hypothetical protein
MDARIYDLDEVRRHSFRDFHAKGLDYLCLKRSPHLTRKVYFFEGNLDKLPEIVMPHDHRYAFETRVLTGRLANRVYCRGGRSAQPFERFDFMTPLNGGDGFTWRETDRLSCVMERAYTRGQTYLSTASDIHTLQIQSDQTVIMLDQFEDVVPLDAPTRAWRKGDKQPPNLSGLYREMTMDDVLHRMAIVSELMEPA